MKYKEMKFHEFFYAFLSYARHNCFTFSGSYYSKLVK